MASLDESRSSSNQSNVRVALNLLQNALGMMDSDNNNASDSLPSKFVVVCLNQLIKIVKIR